MISFPLTRKELSSLYAALQRVGAFCRGEDGRHFKGYSLEELLAVATENARWDIRLLYVMVEVIAKHFTQIRPFLLRDRLLQNSSPQVWGVIKEFVGVLRHSPERAEQLKEFFAITLRGIKPLAQPRLFFLSSGLDMDEIHTVARNSLLHFRRWGYLSTEIPILKHLEVEPNRAHRYGKVERLHILQQLFIRKNPISLGDYLAALDHSVTRQHARLDILSCPKIEISGTTRNAQYLLRK
jgi:hypothetical protein